MVRILQGQAAEKAVYFISPGGAHQPQTLEIFSAQALEDIVKDITEHALALFHSTRRLLLQRMCCLVLLLQFA
jgi:hypothetical protein